MLDSVVIANETIDYLKKEKKTSVMVKVDFEKSYDSVDWELLYYMMGRLGFNDKWVKWIKMCLESATISILINGSPMKEFKPRKGLRQGDPLTLFLFLIVAEGLTGLVREAKSSNLLQGVVVGGNGVHVDLLQFANDMIIFCQPTYRDVLSVKVIMRSFELASGLRVNFQKSNVGGVGVSRQELYVFSRCLNSR